MRVAPHLLKVDLDVIFCLNSALCLCNISICYPDIEELNGSLECNFCEPLASLGSREYSRSGPMLIETSAHGRMGRRFPDGGLIQKMSNTTTVAAMLSNKGEVEFWEM